MNRFSPKERGVVMNSKIKDDSVDFLFQAILSLQNMDECYSFFEDLCTVPEIKAMSQRLLVARMLSENAYIMTLCMKQAPAPRQSAA